MWHKQDGNNCFGKMETTVSEKEKAINQVVKDAYAFISFEKGTTLDYEALKAIFTPDDKFYNFRGDSLAFSNIDDFIAGFKASIDLLATKKPHQLHSLVICIINTKRKSNGCLLHH